MLSVWLTLGRQSRRSSILAASIPPGGAARLAPLETLGQRADHSWLQQLTPDPETAQYAPNKQSRQVRSGHYVPVLPTPLANTKLVIHSPPMAEALGISEEEIASEDFVAFFSGEQGRVAGLQSWCTPYALSIMGQRQTRNCPYGNGNGYGDGRAISVGEVVVDGRRWEMQLKGGGTTPFCRGADGRAVLRSSIREFLASEAMHNLGVDTTRALALVASDTEEAMRPWYAGKGGFMGTGMGRQPDTMISEKCAITTRVAPSFLRIGHLDLFARRGGAEDATPEQREELEQMVRHALFREYPDAAPGQPLDVRAAAMVEAAAERIGSMVAGWLRVGFCQGNFNADNCLVGGRTMDYGPFGWIDKYDPLFAKWTGSGEHFAFMNQPTAAMYNFRTLVISLLPVIGNTERAEELLRQGSEAIARACAEAFRRKLGFALEGSEEAAALWRSLEPLMRRSDVDYTLLWRQLAAVLEASEAASSADDDGEALIAPLRPAFYIEPSAAIRGDWVEWLNKWLSGLREEAGGSLDVPEVAARLRSHNPKYVPREYLLVQAYDKAAQGDYSLVHELYKLFSRPYDEQPDMEAKYYQRAPQEALERAGCAFMT